MKESVTILLFALCGILWSEIMHAQNAITYWKDGIPTTIYSPDSILFWNEQSYLPDGKDDGDIEESTNTEQLIMQTSSNEEEAPLITYSEEDSLRYDALAQEVLAMFAMQSNPSSRRKISNEEIDELSEEAIRKNGNNIFEDPKDGGLKLKIEQQDWNSGIWGKTRYGGFETYYNTFSENGKRYLLVVFRSERGEGFPNKKTAYLKLGQVNSGKILTKTTIYPSREYASLVVCISEYLPNDSYGCVNFFPLLITEGSKARNYLNPIMVKSHPIVPDDDTKGWQHLPYGDEFGKINGVSVYSNTSSKGLNLGGAKYQCVELCKRYIEKHYGYNTSGNAIEWPAKRAKEPDKYIVFANDGTRKVREGDLIVWNYGVYGHIGVVIKTTPKYISVAHQNGGRSGRPIGSVLNIENGIVKDNLLGSSICNFIRMYHSSEDYTSYTASLRASTTNMEFGTVDVGQSKTMTFNIKNSGTSTLTISSMSLTKGEAFSLDASNCTIGQGETRTFTVTFTPTKAEEFKDRIFIQSNAEDNPQWTIRLSGRGDGGAPVGDVPTDGLVAYYPFNGNANDESGNRNHGSVIGNVELVSDRFGNSNSAYRFPGEAFNYISVPDNETLHCSTFTLNAWVYTDADDYGSGYLICKGRDINEGAYHLCVTSVCACNEYGGVNDAYISEIPQTHVWHMITGTVEGNQAKLYIDGTLMDERTLSYPFTYGNSDPMALGMHYYSGVPSYWAYPLLGILDDVRIYNRVLDASEIKSLYREQ